MMDSNSLVFKIASQAEEFEQIHQLNYQMFVEEIPQGQPNENRKLVDKFHDENTYVICVRDQEVIAMIALRDRRPFSLDLKLDNLESYLPVFESILEFRLLAVKKEFRNSKIFSGIMKQAFNMAIQGGYDIAIISGSVHRQRLYEKLGFKPFGPRVGNQDALFQPMYIDIAAAAELKKRSRILKRDKKAKLLNRAN
jgi:predicted N-acetyltransferase YhbS